MVSAPVTQPSGGLRRDLDRDGFAVVEGVLAPDEVASARHGVEAGRRHPGPFHRVLSLPGEPRAESDLFCLDRLEALRRIAHHDRLVALACRALGRDRVVLLEDQWFASDPDAGTPSPWHQDEPYHPLDRPFLTIWLPLDPLPVGHSLRVVTGSHLGPIYAPVEFSADEATLAGEGSWPDPAPDIDSGALPVTEPVLVPGDALLLDSRILHAVAGGPPAVSRRLSLRFADPDTRIRGRAWPTATFWDELQHGLGEGDAIGSPTFPVLGDPRAGGGAAPGDGSGEPLRESPRSPEFR